MNVVWSTKTVSSWRFGATVAVTCGKGSAEFKKILSSHLELKCYNDEKY